MYKFQWAEENYNYYDAEPSLINYSIRMKKRWGQGINDGIIFGKSFYVELYLNERDMKKESQNWYKFYMNPKKLKFYLKEIKKSTIEMNTWIKKIIKIDLSKLTNPELFEVYDIYGLKYGLLMNCYIATQPFRIKKIESELLEFLKTKKRLDINQEFTLLTTPIKSIMFSKEGNDFLNKSFAELIQSENSLIDKKIANKKLYFEKNIKNTEKEKLLLELNPPLKIKKIIEILSILSYERFKMRCVFMPALYYNELFLIEIKRRFKISKINLRAYNCKEIEALIKNGKKISSKKAELRKKGFITILKKNQIKTIDGTKAQKILSTYFPKSKKLNKINGMIACKGYAVGKAIVLSYRKSSEHSKKIKDMQEGEIIITEMTRPNIIPACEKASAIITDEGGVLCHAAIVSRELNKPCIIGTQQSTAIFNDGDYLEVDANKGIIQKITYKQYLTKKQLNKLAHKETISKKEIKVNQRKKGDLLWFKDINLGDIPTVGGKGASLGELAKITCVPEGFCVTTNAYESFLIQNKLKEEIESILKNTNTLDYEGLEKKSELIRELILNKEINLELKKEILKNYNYLKNKNVALRSSATAEDLPNASFAGQQDTYLNINTEKDLLESIKKCWASLFTARAIYYREKNNFKHAQVLISVVIQEMVDAKYAGVIFTKDPINKKGILIEVVNGLGEKLVSGEVTPNTYCLNEKGKLKTKKEIFSFNKKYLSDLSKIGTLIESHYKSPQDIEWAIDNNEKIYILQSRTITTL
jgi:phosphohistidine swiveling domain-containing protein